MHGAIAEQFAVSGELPCADARFLGPLKRSPEFRKLRPRLAGKAPHPVFDSWLDDGFHFFTFVLAPVGEVDGFATDGGLAVFAMHPSKAESISAITVIPTKAGDEAEITNLKEPGGSYTAPLEPTADPDDPKADD